MPAKTVPTHNIKKCIVFSQNKVVVHNDEQDTFIIPQWQLLQNHSELKAYQEQVVTIAVAPDYHINMIDLRQASFDDTDYVSAGLRDILMGSADIDFEYIAKAWQYALFLRTHQYCGQCGATMRQVGWEMARQCDVCQHRVYPRVSPCIIVAIRHEDKILLAQGNRHTATNLYSTLAGFVESGESLEQAVHREVMEEVGVKLKNIEYFDSQPWPFPHSLMMGFVAEYAGGDINVDGKEILDAQWFTYDALPNIPSKVSIAGRLIEHTQHLITQQWKP
jgi:NAD+ diphosphatase